MLRPIATVTTAELRSHRHPWVETQCNQLGIDVNAVTQAAQGVPKEGTYRLVVEVRDGRACNVAVVHVPSGEGGAARGAS